MVPLPLAESLLIDPEPEALLLEPCSAHDGGAAS